eukprot:scaffold74828_cov15-Tisochrysis_lutea.AAC.1
MALTCTSLLDSAPACLQFGREDTCFGREDMCAGEGDDGDGVPPDWLLAMESVEGSCNWGLTAFKLPTTRFGTGALEALAEEGEGD